MEDLAPIKKLVQGVLSDREVPSASFSSGLLCPVGLEKGTFRAVAVRALTKEGSIFLEDQADIKMIETLLSQSVGDQFWFMPYY
jgi:hypothetical protein